MGKKNRKKTTWRRLSLTGEENRDFANDDQDPSDSQHSDDNDDQRQRRPHYRHPPHSNHGRQPFYPHRSGGYLAAHGRYSRAPKVAHSTDPSAPLQQTAKLTTDEEFETAQDENYWPDEQQLCYFHPYFPHYATPTLVLAPPYHPLQWQEDPRLPADCQYYFCLTQPVSVPQTPPTPTSPPSTADSADNEADAVPEQPAAAPEDDESGIPVDEFAYQAPLLQPPPPYVYPGPFMLRPYAYNTNNSYCWWNENGPGYGRRRRRRGGFIGGEGITYDRWPSRKERSCDRLKFPTAAQRATETSKASASMSANDQSERSGVRESGDGSSSCDAESSANPPLESGPDVNHKAAPQSPSEESPTEPQPLPEPDHSPASTPPEQALKGQNETPAEAAEEPRLAHGPDLAAQKGTKQHHEAPRANQEVSSGLGHADPRSLAEEAHLYHLNSRQEQPQTIKEPTGAQSPPSNPAAGSLGLLPSIPVGPSGATGSEEDAPSKALAQSPSEVLIQSPSEVRTQSPSIVLGQSPSAVLTQSLPEVLARSPSEVRTQSPSEVFAQSSSAVLTQSPSEVHTQSPSKVFAQSPSAVLTQSPSEVLTQSPSEVLVQSPSEVCTQSPSRVLAQSPSEVRTQSASAVLTQSSSEVLAQSSSEVLTQSPSESLLASRNQEAARGPIPAAHSVEDGLPSERQPASQVRNSASGSPVESLPTSMKAAAGTSASQVAPGAEIAAVHCGRVSSTNPFRDEMEREAQPPVMRVSSQPWSKERGPSASPPAVSPSNASSASADRQRYYQLEDPMKCSKYYQLCGEVDDDAEERPAPMACGGEIVMHEAADSASECGSEDVEMLGHRYETAAEKRYKSNALSLAVEMLSTNQQLPYDKEFKPIAEGGVGIANPCYTNTQVLEGYYGQLKRQASNGMRKHSGGRNGMRKEVADSGIHTDESGDEGECRNTLHEDDEVLFSRNLGGSNAFQYQPFGRRPRAEHSPLLYLRSKGPWQGCCCTIM